MPKVVLSENSLLPVNVFLAAPHVTTALMPIFVHNVHRISYYKKVNVWHLVIKETTL